jgi:glycerate-2-kinase
MASIHDVARRLAALAVSAVDPEGLVRDELRRRLSAGGRFDAVLAVGKAAAGLARGTRTIFAHSPRRLLIRPHSSPALLDPGWEQATGGHPLPDRQSAAAGARLQAWLARVEPEHSLLALISGGASACVEVPAPGLTLDDLAAAQRALLGAGLSIDRVNAVRKHLSALKGGGALRSTRGRVVVLLLSDVLGDDPSTIASGLFAADPTTHADALATLATLVAIPSSGGADELAAVRRHLEAGARGELPETVKPGDAALERVETAVIGSVRTAVAAVAAEARRQGLTVEEGSLTGEAAAAGRELVARGRGVTGDRVALVWGGETTVTLSGGPGSAGRGGRNGELALAAAAALREGAPAGARELVLALATDGEDGATHKAGALVDDGTWEAVRRAGIDPEAALARHDSLPALAAVPGALLDTGPTGTNVGDLAIYLRLR